MVEQTAKPPAERKWAVYSNPATGLPLERTGNFHPLYSPSEAGTVTTELNMSAWENRLMDDIRAGADITIRGMKRKQR